MNYCRPMSMLKNSIARYFSDCVNEDAKSAMLHQTTTTHKIDSPARCSYLMEQDIDSALIYLPEAIRFTHELAAMNALCYAGEGGRHTSLSDDMRWCASGIASVLFVLTESEVHKAVLDAAVESVLAVLRSWYSVVDYISSCAVHSIVGVNINVLLPPGAVLLNEILERKVVYRGGRLFDILYMDWLLVDPVRPNKSAGWLIFCATVRVNKSDELIFRCPIVLDTVFDHMLIDEHLRCVMSCEHKNAATFAEYLRRQLE